VEIQEAEGLRGLLPIAVRVPKPVSAAAVFYNESTRNILDIRYFHERCISTLPCDSSIPPGLAQWETLDESGGNWAQFSVPPNTGVVIATSFRPACNTGTVPANVVTGPAPCMEDGGYLGGSVDSFCRQTSGGTAQVKCEHANGTGATQTVVSGLQFLRSYSSTPAVTNGPPELRTAYLDSASAACGANVRQSYFNAGTASGCTARLSLTLDLGSVVTPPPPPGGTETRRAANAEVKYKIVNDVGGGACSTFGNVCDLSGSGGPGNSSWSGTIPFNAASARNSIVIRVRLTKTTVGSGASQVQCPQTPSALCEWYYTAQGRGGLGIVPTDAQILANPVQRAFMGDINKSGAVKWLRLAASTGCTGAPDLGIPETAGAASVQTGTRCFYLTMGLQGGLAKDQDEPPIQLNIGATSQSAVLDCDPNIPNLKGEIVTGCQDPVYARNRFDTSPRCPDANQFFNSPKAAPFNPPDNYPPWRCVLTQPTAAPNQIVQGLSERLFGDSSNPSCPADPGNTTGQEWRKGRNYWHNANNTNTNFTFADDRVGYGVTDPNPADNLPNRIKTSDPRLVTLFFTPYDSFTGSGNATYPVVGFGTFYITGYAEVLGNGNFQGGKPEDPCTTGNTNPSPGAGNKPPPDLDAGTSGAVAWGHFVKEVVPNPSATPSGIICRPTDFQPCLPVLVE
jgi:hypothetical protein